MMPAIIDAGWRTEARSRLPQPPGPIQRRVRQARPSTFTVEPELDE
ncbi:hypothetical protein [Nocardia suismassiliense]|nr:hypothetical protein [Nocardia suismassiliense]